VGFDFNGTLKLFDFGLAKELDSRQKNRDGNYEMSGATGSRRYMSPEVARSEPYHLAADMYSFGILLWEVLSLEKAFWDMTLEAHTERVVNGDERPKISKKWPVSVQTLIESCWHKDVKHRRSAKQAHKVLQQELESYSKDHSIKLPKSKRSSM
jgi:serine/threonine protein kinase